ncbi:hypothetical protein FN846DRAFT_406507 [Sphaerosporella brunnea]|uniref:Uncharacterized protein n=1 Tax=Sphaerosporella brunnea TaxID=1250544 RepID=A0A5J5EH06_9PEZI|nr:hypothetical protein FN846DRAFT_406507 [Sphaerosporella brunnea]
MFVSPRTPPHSLTLSPTITMFNLLPAPIICTIFDSTNSLTAATSLSQCSRFLSQTWKSHLASLDLSRTFDSDPRWRSEKYRFFAVSIVRARLEATGEPFPTTNDTIKAGYKTAGIINRTAREISAALPAATSAVETKWREYVLVKTLYMLWIASITGGGPCDPEYWVDTPEMVAFLLQPRWREFGYPNLAGLKNVVVAIEKAPSAQIGEICAKIEERVKRNRELVGADIAEIEGEEGGGVDENLPDDYYDDSDLDDLSELEEDEEFFVEEYDEDEY